MKLKYIFVFFVLLIFITSCQQSKPIETVESLEDANQLEKQGDKTVDLCKEIDLMNGDLASLYGDLAKAEDELNGLKVDLDYAKEDGKDTAELEKLIKNQEDYITKIKSMISDLEKTISNC